MTFPSKWADPLSEVFLMFSRYDVECAHLPSHFDVGRLIERSKIDLFLIDVELDLAGMETAETPYRQISGSLSGGAMAPVGRKLPLVCALA